MVFKTVFFTSCSKIYFSGLDLICFPLSKPHDKTKPNKIEQNKNTQISKKPPYLLGSPNLHQDRKTHKYVFKKDTETCSH